MEAIEKAKELYEKYMERGFDFESFYGDERHENAKQSALICIEEIISSYNLVTVNVGCNFNPEYWLEVRKELDKL